MFDAQQKLAVQLWLYIFCLILLPELLGLKLRRFHYETAFKMIL